MQIDVENKEDKPAGLQLLTKKQVANLLASRCRSSLFKLLQLMPESKTGPA